MSGLLTALNRRTIRGPINPMDKSTVVSIYPKRIKFTNITLMPRQWVLEAGSVENPAVLVVGPASWWKETNPNEDPIEIVQGSVIIANSLVNDYCNGIHECDLETSMPGLFWVPGPFTAETIKKEHKALLESAIAKQTNYYRRLLGQADALWARSNGNPLVVNDEMRLAAKVLGAQDKDWMHDHQAVGMTRCFACGEFKNPEFPICKHCRSIDPNHPKAKDIKLAANG